MSTWLRIVCVVAVLAGAVAPAAAQDAAAARRRAQQTAQETRRQTQRQAQERARTQREQARNRSQNNRQNWPEVTEQFSRTIRLDRGGIVDIENISGDITITGGGGNDVRIEAVKRMRHADEQQARALLPELRIDVIERAGRVEIRTGYPRTRGISGEVDYTLAVPSGADLVIKTISGDLRVSNVRGELRAGTVSGNVEISGAEGDISARAMSGDIAVRGAKARSARLETVSGDLRLTDVELERADLGTMSGDIDYAGRLARAGRYELRTHNGDIRVTPVNPSGFDLEASTFNGDVVSEFELKLGPRPDNRGRRGVNRTVRGTFGDAGAVIALRSFNGDITIVKR
jgi:DUF4097 and DUF4098 domain-containing protein YvlB/Sec-independent protein translocase protein TatA